MLSLVCIHMSILEQEYKTARSELSEARSLVENARAEHHESCGPSRRPNNAAEVSRAT